MAALAVGNVCSHFVAELANLGLAGKTNDRLTSLLVEWRATWRLARHWARA